MACKAAGKASAVAEVRYAAHMYTSAVRPYPTKEGKLLRNGEKSTPEEFLKLFTPQRPRLKNQEKY